MRENAATISEAQPRYQQVKDHIIELNNNGVLKPKDPVPTDNELVK